MESENTDSEDDGWNKPVDESDNQVNIPYNKQILNKPEPTHPCVILHIDIDCFYAQVEMLRKPDLKNKPLGIQQKYIIVTCNYVAREQGLTKLMTVKDALEKCPDLVLVSGEDLTNYRHMSYKISNYLQKYCPLVERLGFDENFLDITELVNDRLHKQSVAMTTEVKGHIYVPEGDTDVSCCCGCKERLTIGSHIAQEIRAGLFKELGITCCAGIAHNKLLSKLVASTHKPNQQTTLYPHTVNLLMSSLKSVRNIQGIGHTTARRLKEVGVVSVADLQNVDQSVLEEEFGHASVETMKKLCLGIDDSPVIAFGLPQTLSDEDSFKKCSNVEDVKSKIKQLINSLLHRLLEDGRRPQTLRLSVRRMLETNRYNNRESRQCSIPSSVFNKFSSDNLTHSSSQLETLAYGLFTKMVAVKSPFHLTLINVAFAKLEQKSSNDISSFFSPKKQSSQSSPTQSGDRGSADTGRATEAVPFECKESSKQKGLGLNDQEYSPELTTKKGVSGIQKWVIKQPTNSEQSCTGNSSKGNLSSQVSTSAYSNTESFESRMSLKRLASDNNGGTCNEKDENVAKRKCNSLGSFKLPSNIAEILPQDLDLDVFLELPPDIQKDVLNNIPEYYASRNKKHTFHGQDTYTYKSSLKSNLGMPSTSLSTSENNSLNNENKTKKNIHTADGHSGTASDANIQTGSTALFKDAQIETCFKNSVTSNKDGKCTLDKHSAQSFHCFSKTNVNLNMPAFNKLSNCDTNSKETTSEAVAVPNNVDPAVFESLPPDIKEELTQQWKKEKVSTATNSVKPAGQKKLFFKSPKPSTSNNITDYFCKK